MCINCIYVCKVHLQNITWTKIQAQKGKLLMDRPRAITESILNNYLSNNMFAVPQKSMNTQLVVYT